MQNFPPIIPSPEQGLALPTEIVVRGRGINLSFVGKGTVIFNGAGTDDDGAYAANGADYSLIPSFPFTFQLSATSPSP